MMNNEMIMNKRTIFPNVENEITIMFYDGVDDKSCRAVIEQMIEVEDYLLEQRQVNEQLADKSKLKPPIVILRISSFGGSLYDCMAVVNEIEKLQSLGVKVVGEVNAYAASAAFIILMACDIRTVTGTYAELLYHNMLVTQIHENINDTIRELERLQKGIWKHIEQMILRKSKITQEMLDKYKHDDWIMDIEEARRLEVLNDKAIVENTINDMMKDMSDEEKEQVKQQMKELGLEGEFTVNFENVEDMKVIGYNERKEEDKEVKKPKRKRKFFKKIKR